MSRFAFSLAVMMLFVSGAEMLERDADACGVKLAIKTLRQRQRAKQAPINAEDKPLVAARRARTPVAAGPATGNGRPGIVIKVKPTDPVAAKEPGKEPAKEPAAAGGKEPAKEPVAMKAPAPTTAVAKDATKEPAKEVAKEPVKQAASEPAKAPAKEPAKPKRVAKAKPTGEPAKPGAPASDKVATTTTPAAEPAAPAEPLETEVYFAVGRITLDNRDGIIKAQRWLMTNPSQKIVIEGYADPQGRTERNMTLSKQRAEVTRAFLVSQGIAESRIEIAAFGDTKLKYDRTDDRNRRVVLHSK
jgi:outer membrane protein OmpA-like peptidoglycan-associated protein